MTHDATGRADDLPNRLLTLRDAAEYIAVSDKTLRRFVAEGRIPAYRVGPRQLRFKLTDLDALLQRVPTAGQDPR